MLRHTRPHRAVWPPWKPRVDAIEFLTKRRDIVYQLVHKEQQSKQQRIVSASLYPLRTLPHTHQHTLPTHPARTRTFTYTFTGVVTISEFSRAGLGFVRFHSQIQATMAGQLILAKNRLRLRAIPAPVRASCLSVCLCVCV